MKVIKKIGWILLCIAVFVGVFTASVVAKIGSVLGGDSANYTLQSGSSEDARYNGQIIENTMDVQYINYDGAVNTRQIIVYRPGDAQGEIPLIYIPHYQAETEGTEFHQYLSHGWAVASPIMKNEYNGQLVGDDLIFNNAALYTLRNMDGIDNQRIAIVGGSAGGYTALMLSELQMGVAATIANSPISNIYYNFNVHFPACDEANRNSGLFHIAMPVQLMVTKMFRGNLEYVSDSSDATRWADISPIGNAKAISSPVVVNHYTADILVPVDQITKHYTYSKRLNGMPEEVPLGMADDYPGILSMSLEEMADQNEVSVTKYELENNHLEMDMPYSDSLLTINIFDDGPMNPNGGHASPDVTGAMNTMKYLENAFSKTLKETEVLNDAKIILLLERFLGNSKQLPVYVNVDDTLYGSLAIYQKEVIASFAQYVMNHSLEELESIVLNAIDSFANKQEIQNAWDEIRVEIGN